MEKINHPQHYTQGDFEVIDIIRDKVKDFDSYCEGNAIKYLLRYKFKGDSLSDLEKCRWYVNALIKSEWRKKQDAK